VSVPGWYPDPAGIPNRLRYWDGRSWTTNVTDDAPGTDGSGGGKSGKGWLWAVLIGAVAIVVAVALVWISIGGGTAATPAETYSPTISAWNESETPTPTPTPTPSEPSPSITELRCDQEGEVQDLGATVTGSRLVVGGLSMPVAPSTWDGPTSQSMITYGEGAYGYTTVIESHELITWSNTMIIGPTNFAQSTDLETQARTIVACLAGTDVMDRYKAPSQLDIKKTKVSGHDAVQADAVYSWNDPELDTKGSLIRVVVVSTSQGPFFFLGEATKERADMIEVLKNLSGHLAAS
jgi:hypothetical protein